MTSNYSSKVWPLCKTAGPNEVSFLNNERHAWAWDQTLAGACANRALPILQRECRRGPRRSEYFNHTPLGHASLDRSYPAPIGFS